MQTEYQKTREVVDIRMWNTWSTEGHSWGHLCRW